MSNGFDGYGACAAWLRFLLIVLLPAGLISSRPAVAQLLKPEKVFRKETIERKGIQSATLTMLDEYRAPLSETYLFTESGQYTGCIRNSANQVDTLYERDIERSIIKEQSQQRRVITKLEYDSTGRLWRKAKMVHDTLHSVVNFSYDLQGRLIMTAEVNGDGDTLTTARYIYEGKRIREIAYTGLEIHRIEYLKKGNRLTERAYNLSGEVMFNRVEVYNRNNLLRAQTVSVPGFKVVPTTRFRYSWGLLRTVIQPDGIRIRVRYSYRH